MSIIILSVLFGVVLGELVRCGIRWYRAAHFLDITPVEAAEMLRKIYGRAADRCFLENARHRVHRVLRGGTEDFESLCVPSAASAASVSSSDFSDIDANDVVENFHPYLPVPQPPYPPLPPF